DGQAGNSLQADDVGGHVGSPRSVRVAAGETGSGPPLPTLPAVRTGLRLAGDTRLAEHLEVVAMLMGVALVAVGDAAGHGVLLCRNSDRVVTGQATPYAHSSHSQPRRV